MQPERTALAWRRTGLVLLAGALVAFRLAPEFFGTWAFAPAGLGLVVSIFVFGASHRRYSEQHARLTRSETDRIALPDGALPALVTGLTALGGVAALALVLSAAL